MLHRRPATTRPLRAAKFRLTKVKQWNPHYEPLLPGIVEGLFEVTDGLVQAVENLAEENKELKSRLRALEDER